jgi:hypothetical protein
MKLTEKQLHILQHSLGLDQYGQGNQYRNRFFTGPGSSDFADCNALVEAGLMRDDGAQKMCAGDHFFYVTEAGIKQVEIQSPSPPKIFRSKRRYLEWLDADCGMKFGDWLKLKSRRQSA